MHICFLFLRAASFRVRQQRSLHLLSLFLAALPILLLAACGSSSSSTSTPPPNIQVAVWPATALVFTGQAMSFTATVTGSSNAGVIWMVQEGLSGGRVSNTGVYTAPASAGTFHVVASSRIDPSKVATVTVTVPGPGPAPTFTSTAPTSASEGQAYSYAVAATDPAGGAVSYQLTSGPTNASLSGSILTWTPGHAQSRIANGFTITATTSEQGSSTQTFTVTPNGNIDGVLNIIDYNTNGKVVIPIETTGVVAYVPTGTGSYTQITGTTGLGTFSVPNVPPGYFLLQIGVNSTKSQLLWTNASDVDFSNPVQGRTDSTHATTISTLKAKFTLATGGPSWDFIRCDLFIPNLGSSVFFHFFGYGFFCPHSWQERYIYLDPTESYGWYFPLPDPTKGDQTYVYHSQSIDDLLDNWSGYRLVDFAGPFDLAIPDGGTVNFSGNMTAQDPNQSVRANVAVSQFAALAGGVSSNFAGIYDLTYEFTMSVQPYTAEYYLNLGPVITDVNNSAIDSSIVLMSLHPYGETTSTDADLGDLPYANPFPAAWPTYASFAFKARLPYNVGTTQPADLFAGIGTLTLNTPTAGSPLVPLVGPATSIKINGNDFFQAQANAGTQPVVSWSAPSVGVPDGYTLNVIQLTSGFGGSVTLTGNHYTIYTAQTSITLPPGILQSGYDYVFQLQAFKGNNNVEKAPLLATFPWGYADAFSGLVHVGP